MKAKRQDIPFEFRCPKCGGELTVRKFERFEDLYEYGIFDHCLKPDERSYFPTEKEAIIHYFNEHERDI